MRSAYRMIRPDRLKESMAIMLNERYPGVKIEDVSISDLYDMDTPMEIEVAFSCPSYVTDMEELLVFPLPSEGFSAYATLVGSSERQHELNLGYNMAMEQALKITFPKGYAVAGLPEDKEVKYEFGEFIRKYEVVSDSTIRYFASLKVDIPAIPVADYASFKNLIETAAREDRAQIILKKSTSATVPQP